ncbi:MAG: TonB family protein [Candidatus Krumholzibacteria bacterium]|nr:TonB family protein [Candidatus Krumholzibacteria bacterium]
MTINRVYAAAGSANEEFKSQYVRSLRWASLGAVTLTALMVWFSPQYIPTPYTLPDEAMQITEVEIIYKEDKPKEIPPAPMIPKEIEIVDKDYEGPLEEPPDTTVPYPPVQPSYFPPSDVEFVASSSKPQLVFQAKPHYPEVARLAQVEGTVIVKVLVSVNGEVTAAEIVQGQHPLLNNAALKAARRCLFKPGEQRKIKVPTWVAVPYNFRLR